MFFFICTRIIFSFSSVKLFLTNNFGIMHKNCPIYVKRGLRKIPLFVSSTFNKKLLIKYKNDIITAIILFNILNKIIKIKNKCK